MIRSLFGQLVVLFSRYNSQDTHSGKDQKLQLLSKAITFMEGNYKEVVQIGKLSDIANMSERQFLRTFKECFQCSPIKYLNKLRLEHAKKLLWEQQLEIKEIAYKCGFTDPNYFTRKFTQSFGVSPKRFKN